MAKDVYLPLMMGDWIRGTRGMKAEVKGVYIDLLIHQFDNGYIPSDMDELSLIQPEVGKVWVMLRDKFEEIEPGRLQNKKLEEVRAFWAKQRKNGKKGGRPKKENLNINPNKNPKTNLHNDSDSDLNIDLKIKKESATEIDFTQPDVQGDTIVFHHNTDAMLSLWARWKETRWVNHRMRYSIYGEQADLDRLRNLNFQQVETALNAAIAGKWQNLYPSSRANGNESKTNRGVNAHVESGRDFGKF